VQIDGTKTYGELLGDGASLTYDFALGDPHFTAVVNGLQNGETLATIDLSSLGFAAAADVAGSPYDITGANLVGDTANLNNYSFNLVPPVGGLAVTPANLSIQIDGIKTYGEVLGDGASLTYNFALGDPHFTAVVNGLQNGETLATIDLSSLGFAGTASVAGSPYDVTGANLVGGTANLNNYSVSLVPPVGSLAVTPANLILVANNQIKFTGTTFTFNGTEFTPFGLQNGETIGSVVLSSLGAPAGAPFGLYPINISGPAGGTADLNNYSITLVPGLMLVGISPGNWVYDQFTRYEYYWQSIDTLPFGTLHFLGRINGGGTIVNQLQDAEDGDSGDGDGGDQ
jgi:hypothetical protein